MRDAPPLLLLHGAWHSSAAWDPIAKPLREQGYEVHTPDLPGHGADPLPLQKLNFKRYVSAISATLEQLRAPALVVGHSMAGAILAQCSSDSPQRIREAIYLCAYLPCDGESVFDLMADERSHGAPLPIEAALRMSEDKRSCTISDCDAAALFYADANTELRSQAVAALQAQATLPLAGKVQLNKASFDTVQRTYICCTQDRVIPIQQQRRMLQRHSGTDLLQFEWGHSPFLSHSRPLIDLLVGFLEAPRG